MGFHHVDQAGLELLTLGNPPASASQSAGITGVSRGACKNTSLQKGKKGQNAAKDSRIYFKESSFIFWVEYFRAEKNKPAHTQNHKSTPTHPENRSEEWGPSIAK